MRQHFTPHWCRVSVDLGRSKSLICTWVESLTSPTVIIQGKSAFLHTEQVRSSILIKCLPPYIVKWIGLLMSEYYNRHNRLASTCPLSNLSPVFGPSIKGKQEQSPSNARNGFLYLIQRQNSDTSTKHTHIYTKCNKIVEEGIKTLKRENNKIVEEGIKKIEEGKNKIVGEEEGNKNEKGEG